MKTPKSHGFELVNIQTTMREHREHKAVLKIH